MALLANVAPKTMIEKDVLSCTRRVWEQCFALVKGEPADGLVEVCNCWKQNPENTIATMLRITRQGEAWYKMDFSGGSTDTVRIDPKNEQVEIFHQVGTKTDSDGAAKRRNMVSCNIEKIETAYAMLSKQKPGMECVVLVLDLNDSFGNVVATAAAGAEYVQKIRDEINADGMIPTAHIPMTRKVALQMLRKYQTILHQGDNSNPKESNIVEFLAKPAVGGFHVISIGSGGKQYVCLPKPESV